MQKLIPKKVYYHLEQFSESMFYALGAGKLFDPSKKSEYIDTLISKCIDEYIKLKKEQAESTTPTDIKIDDRLERIVLGMFDRCYTDKQFKQALGIAVESRRLDKIEESIRKSDDVATMLVYCQNLCSDVVTNRDFRHTVFQFIHFISLISQILRSLVKLYKELRIPDYHRICECLVFLDDSKSVSEILNTLIQSNDKVRQNSFFL